MRFLVIHVLPEHTLNRQKLHRSFQRETEQSGFQSDPKRSPKDHTLCPTLVTPKPQAPKLPTHLGKLSLAKSTDRKNVFRFRCFGGSQNCGVFSSVFGQLSVCGSSFCFLQFCWAGKREIFFHGRASDPQSLSLRRFDHFSGKAVFLGPSTRPVEKIQTRAQVFFGFFSPREGCFSQNRNRMS